MINVNENPSNEHDVEIVKIIGHTVSASVFAITFCFMACFVYYYWRH